MRTTSTTAIPYPAVQFSADGTRAAVTTLVSGASPSSRIVVLNLTNGAQLGTTLTENAAATTELSADGTRLAIATVTQDGTTHKYSTTLKLVNTATGAIVGAPATVTGVDRQTPQFTADGSRAIFTVFPVNSDGRFTAVTVHTFNAATGARVGSAVTVSGVPNGLNSVELSPNGQRAVISAITGDSSSGPTTNYVVLNTATGTKVGATISVAGVAAEFENGAEFSSDGTRAYVDAGCLGFRSRDHPVCRHRSRCRCTTRKDAESGRQLTRLGGVQRRRNSNTDRRHVGR